MRTCVRLCLLLPLLLSACTPPRSEPPTPPPGQSTAPKTEVKKRKLAGIVFQEDQFFRLVMFGMRDAAKKHGVELLEGNSQSKLEKEIQLVRDYTAQKVDAIVISPYSKDASVPALKEAHDKGVVIVCHNTPLNADFPASYLECSPEDLGMQTGTAAKTYITDKLAGKAKIGVLAFDSQVPEQSKARVGGFKKALEGMGTVEWVAQQDAWLPEMAVKKATDILTAHPDLDILYAANEGGTVGATMAVKAAGRAGKVVVFGTDCSDQLLSFLRDPDDILQAITSQRPFEVGQKAVERALDKLDGKPVEAKTILNGTLLWRKDPAAIQAFAEQFASWAKGGK